MSKRNRTIVLAVALALSSVAALAADDPCPCVPLGKLWIAESCETWNCAASALIMANGDPNVMVIPMATDRFKWAILRRVVAGSATTSDGAFQIETFTSMTDGSARYNAIDRSFAPMLTTANDGNILLVYLRDGGTTPPPSRGTTTGR